MHAIRIEETMMITRARGFHIQYCIMYFVRKNLTDEGDDKQTVTLKDFPPNDVTSIEMHFSCFISLSR